jgi:hypothetical protein
MQHTKKEKKLSIPKVQETSTKNLVTSLLKYIPFYICVMKKYIKS